MKVLLIKNNRLNSYLLPFKIENNFWIKDIDNFNNERNLINVIAKDGKWYLKSNYETKIINGKSFVDEILLKEGNFYIIKNESEDAYYYLYGESSIEKNYHVYRINGNGSIKVGKTTDCDIIYGHALMGDIHAILSYEDGKWQIVDNKSKFGIYVNNRKVNRGIKLNYGDIIFIVGLKIVVLKDSIYINNINNYVHVKSKILSVKMEETFNLDNSILKEEELDRELYSKDEYYYRSPRIVEDVLEENIKIDDPPGKQTEQESSLLLTLGPMFTMGLTSMTSLYSTLNNISNGSTTMEKSIPSLIMAGATLCSMLIWPLVSKLVMKRLRKKREKKRVETYSNYLKEKKKEILAVAQKQSQTLKDKYITLDECQNIIVRRRSNLWERGIDQTDFLSLRLGIGSMPIVAKIDYSLEHFTMEEDELKKEVKTTVEENNTLKDVPIPINLVNKYILSIIGNNYLCKEFFKGLLLQMVTYHSYEFLKIIILTDDENKADWDYLRNIPYLFDDYKQVRFFGTNIDEIKEISLYLEKIYQGRNGEDNREAHLVPPYYLVVTDNYHMYRDVEIVTDILNQKVNNGFGIVILNEKIQNLPSECKTFINVNKDESGIFESEISKGAQKSFKTEFVNNIALNDCLRRVSNIPIEFNDEEKQLPNSISFLEMYGVGTVEQLTVWNRWQTNNSQKSLSVPVGIEKSGTQLKLDLHEKYHGPHGLIAGMTGSGKSEFIITYILSLAINFSPLDVSFILIDYKGGGLAGAFENRETGVRLPHLAGTITNLDTQEMNRSLASIQSELRRRQAVFNEARDKLGESTVDIYKYQKFFKEGKVEEPIPHLFIISDEFAELKSQQPDFMDQLISAARIGRSLGVHLILATQKPSGVVNEQIWSNTRFRVCLKVQDKSDSTEMIKRPDAATLKQAGRFYLQVGYNELFALGQSGWCGAQYTPKEKIKKKIDQSINIIDNMGNVVISGDDETKEVASSQGEELGNILKHIIQISKENNLKTKQLWLEKILPEIFVDNLANKYEYHSEPFILNPIIGEFDDPNNQRQDVLTVNLTTDGNMTVYGSAGSGKEMFLNTMIYSLVTNHSPEEVNIYIIDFGAGTMKSFKDLPHVGDIALSNDEEKVYNLFKLIEEEIQKRKKLFVEYNGDYQSYIKRSGKTVPYYILMINNYDAFQDSFDFDDRLGQLTRDCYKYGIILVATLNSVSGMRYKLRQNFRSDITLQLNDQDDYSAIVGNTHKLYPSNNVGRGLVKIENDIYEFQTAYSYKDEEFQDKIKELSSELNEKYETRAKKIPTVPNIVYPSILTHKDSVTNLSIGFNKETIDEETFNFDSNYVTLISASDVKTMGNFLEGFMDILEDVPNNNIVLVDAISTLNNDYPTNVSYVDKDFDNIFGKINATIKMQYDQFVADGYSNKSLLANKHMTVIINGFGRFLQRLTPDGQTNFYAHLEKGKELHTFSFILIDQPEVFKKFEFEKWYKTSVDNTYGVWFGNGVADQTVIKTNIGFKKDNNEIPKRYGVVVKNTKTYLVNLVTKEGDVDE